MPKKLPFARGRTLCIFCGKGPVTKEHMFGKWIRKYLPARDQRGAHHVRHGLSAIAPGKMHNRQGGILSNQIRVVCGNCNHGWMRETQEAVAPYLISLLVGNWVALGPNECSAIASWFALFTMVHEFVDLKTVAVTQTERIEFMEARRPPKGWTIMLGRYSDRDPDNDSACNHFAFGLYEPSAILKFPSGLLPEANAQIPALAMGGIVLYGASTSSGRTIDDFGLSSLRFNLPVIWPNTAATQISPPVLIHNFRSWSNFSNETA